MAYFQLDVSKAKGINTVEVMASGNGETSTYKVELDVINTNPITSKAIDKTGNRQCIRNFRILQPLAFYGTNTATVEFSTLPPMDFTKSFRVYLNPLSTWLCRANHIERVSTVIFRRYF